MLLKTYAHMDIKSVETELFYSEVTRPLWTPEANKQIAYSWKWVTFEIIDLCWREAPHTTQILQAVANAAGHPQELEVRLHCWRQCMSECQNR